MRLKRYPGGPRVQRFPSGAPEAPVEPTSAGTPAQHLTTTSEGRVLDMDMRKRDLDTLRKGWFARIFIALAALIGMTVVAAPFALADTSIQVGNNVQKITINESDYAFSPKHLTFTAGQTVRITLVNKSTDKTHEFLMGKNLKKCKDNFGKTYACGWQKPLIPQDSMVIYGQGHGIDELQVDQPSQVALLDKGGTVTMQFTVPKNAAGDWQFGCFEQKGSHFTDHGMKGTITIKPASGS